MGMQEAARSRRMQDLQRQRMSRAGRWPDSTADYDVAGRIRQMLRDMGRGDSRR